MFVLTLVFMHSLHKGHKMDI